MTGKKHPLPPMDAMFIQAETTETMMHVAGLNIFKLPAGRPKVHLRDVVEEFWAVQKVYPPFNYVLAKPESPKALRHHWIETEDVDLDYHIRRSALPAPADERELGILISRLHSNPMDLRRPLWEMHLIEGLKGNRFALYFKIHHGLVDGISGMKMLARSLSTDPEEADKLPVFATPPSKRSKRSAADGFDLPSMIAQTMDAAKAQVSTAKDLGKSLNALYDRVRGQNTLTLPTEAPHSVLNGSVTRSRRFATALFGLSDLKSLAKAGDCSLNELVLAICATVLRRFLLDMQALPEKPLVAAIPLSLRPEGDSGGGNQVSMVLSSLATDIADPTARFVKVRTSAQDAVRHLRGQSPLAVMAYGSLQLMPVAIQSVTGRLGKGRPNFNVVISNVPGPKDTLYFRGSKLVANYPVSIVMPGQALNITLQSYADTLNFGFIGCSKTLPHLQNMALYAQDAVDELKSILSK